MRPSSAPLRSRYFRSYLKYRRKFKPALRKKFDADLRKLKQRMKRQKKSKHPTDPER